MQPDRTGRVGEVRAVAGVQIALRRQSIGQQDVMHVEFDVVVADGSAAHLGNRGAVDQIFDRDQRTIHEHRMIRR